MTTVYVAQQNQNMIDRVRTIVATGRSRGHASVVGKISVVPRQANNREIGTVVFPNGARISIDQWENAINANTQQPQQPQQQQPRQTTQQQPRQTTQQQSNCCDLLIDKSNDQSEGSSLSRKEASDLMSMWMSQPTMPNAF